ncbi:MAG: hypothetical protein Q8M17_12880 [Actinomycetota bacterium]|nr:hypothetical protein [Actinomycetota bacterium]
MHPLDITDILTALRHADPDLLAAAIYADHDPHLLDALARTLAGAADRTAAHPHPEVIAHGDALLHEVLRWPVADAVPPGHPFPSPAQLAATRGIPEPDAARLLRRIAATEAIAATRLAASGLRVDFTLEQAQVTTCIHALLAAGITPTRHAVRAHAHHIAAAASPGGQPVIGNDAGLPPRVMSNSPMAHVAGWLDRMDADPPQSGMLDARIDYLKAAVAAMGHAARQHTHALAHLDHARTRAVEHAPHAGHHPTPGIDGIDAGQRIAV